MLSTAFTPAALAGGGATSGGAEGASVRPSFAAVTVADSAGSAPVGSARYPVPAGAVFVSQWGSDSGLGTAISPVRTIARGLAVAPAGGTVVLRTGTYHESVTIAGKRVTLQNYPGEHAWLDGSTPVRGWVADGTAWRHDGWTARFDHSPTYTPGAPDSTNPGWQFVNPVTAPMAAHPDQLWLDGVQQRQVKSRALVAPGTFYVDEAASRLFVGTNPAGRAVSAAVTAKALTIRSAGTVVRGIGVRRYSPSVWMVGAVTLEAPHTRLENVIVWDTATTGVGVLATDVVLKSTTIHWSGMLGLHARYADRLLLDSVLSTRNNFERFNTAPVSGGAKLGATRGVRVQGSSFSDNYGHGFWEDLSVYDTVLRQSSFSRNVSTGIFLEISAKAIVGDNLVVGNGEEGIKVNNTSDVKIWNNTIVDNARPLNMVQDSRRNTNRYDQAVDPRQPFPDPTMPWTLGPVTISNNAVGQPSSRANCLLCVEDYSFQHTAEQMRITSNGNVYNRASRTSPSWLAVWSRGTTRNPYVFDTIEQLRATTGQERSGREYVGRSIFADGYTLAADIVAAQGLIARPLPADVAAAIGRPAGQARIGAW